MTGIALQETYHKTQVYAMTIMSPTVWSWENP